MANGPRPWVILAGVVLLTATVLGRLGGQDFLLWDDDINIYANVLFNPPSWAHLATAWTSEGFFQYVPVTETAWSLLAAIGHLDAPLPNTTSGALLDPHVFHTANLVFHLVNVGLVFWILRTLVRADLPAAAGALLFAIHPVQVESVAWVSELRGVLAGFFGLLTILLYVRHVRAGGRIEFAAGLLALVAGMLSKPSVVAVPVVLVLIDRYLLGRPWRQVAQTAGAFFVIVLPLALLPTSTQPGATPFSPVLWQRPLVAADTLAFYLYKLVLPVNLGIDYGRTPQSVLGGLQVWFTWIAPAGLAAVLWLLRKRFPWAWVAGAVGLAGVLPVLGLVTFAFQFYSTPADRYLYLAMLGPALALAFGLTAVVGRTRTIALAGTGGALLVLSVLSFQQAGNWTDTRTLMAHSAAVNPRSDLAYNNLGIADGKSGNLAAAEVELKRSIALNPRQYQAHSNLGNVFFLEHRTDDAIAEYRRSIAIRPDWDQAHSNYANVLMTQRHYAEAVEEYRLALRYNPGSVNADRGLQRALLQLELGG